MQDLAKIGGAAREFPTIERLADLTQTTVGYQGPVLVEEAVRCWHKLTRLTGSQAQMLEALTHLYVAAEAMRHDGGHNDALVAAYDGWAREARAALEQGFKWDISPTD